MIHKQELTRKKYQRVFCPICNATSKVVDTFYYCENRVCRNGHTFSYDKKAEEWRNK